MIDWSKPIETRDGRAVRIWTREALCDPHWPVQGEVLNDDRWVRQKWRADGKYLAPEVRTSKGDLVNVPTKHTKWGSVYQSTAGRCWIGDLHDSEERAREIAKRTQDRCLATIKIEFEEEGL